MSSKYEFLTMNDNVHDGEAEIVNRLSQLDSEFDQHLADMKKYILDLKERKSKQLCALWIKKLCESSDADSVNTKLIRNGYSLKLLNILENFEPLKYPFNERPPSERETLKPINEMISKNHKENANKLDNDSNKHDVEIVTIKNDSSSENNFENNSSQNILYQWNQSSFNSRQFDEKQKLPFEYQLKTLENKFKEEKLNLQQFHNSELQKILDRKNNEIESLKSNFNKKKKEYDENINALERKIQQLTKQANNEKDSSDKSYMELKTKLEKMHEKKQLEFEKRLNETVNKYEKEKFDIQKQHTKAFQDLVDETNVRLKKVEHEYNEQQSINDKVICELENRTQLLKNEIEKNILIGKNLQQENKEKQTIIESLQKQLNEENNKNKIFENELQLLNQANSRELDELNGKYEFVIDQKVKEIESLISKTNELSYELTVLKSDYERKIEKLNQNLKEKDSQLANANNTIKQQKYQAELALNELKVEIEKNSNKLFEEMRDQMTKVENDLEKSKSLREKQSKEYQKQMELLKNEHKKEIDKLKNDHEKERLNAKHELDNEKQRLVKNHEFIYDQLQSQYQQQMIDNGQSYKLRIDELNKTISELEMRLLKTEQDLIESDSLRKQQIMELGLLRDDEKTKLSRNNELELENIKHRYEQDLASYKKQFKDENERLREELKATQKQCDERCRRLNEKIVDLEESLKHSHMESKKLRECLDKEKNERYSTVEAEKASVKKYYSSQLNKFEKDLQVEKSKCKSIEKKLKQLSFENEQNILNLKMHYEERLKGLLPLSIKNDYEETIHALRSQVDSLQQRTIILQSELDDRNHYINSSYTPSI